MIEIICMFVGDIISIASVWISNALSEKNSWNQKYFDLLVNCYSDVLSCYKLTNHGNNKDAVKELSTAIEKASFFVNDKSEYLMQELLIATMKGCGNSLEQSDLEIKLRLSAQNDMRNYQRTKH